MGIEYIVGRFWQAGIAFLPCGLVFAFVWVTSWKESLMPPCLLWRTVLLILCGVSVSFLLFWHNTWDSKLMKKEALFWLRILEVWGCGQLPCCFGSYIKTGGKTWASKLFSYGSWAAKRKRERGESQYPMKGKPPVTWLLHSRQPFLNVLPENKPQHMAFGDFADPDCGTALQYISFLLPYFQALKCICIYSFPLLMLP